MKKQIRPALTILAMLTLITGVLYPLVVTGIAQAVFPNQANGSLVYAAAGEPVGSTLIGQPFAGAQYFWGRPSATAPFPYNAAASSGSNQGPVNPGLEEAVRARILALRQADPANNAAVPADLVTASGSGLDPHISPAAAFYQVARVARTRGMREEDVRALVESHVDGPQLGLLGEARVNVLLLNLALDEAQIALQSK
jgi:K+-transporting ATPase ATPase C chain